MREELINQLGFDLPTTAQECRERIKTLQDEISSIRIQIATTDIRRQVDKKTLDPTWYHRSKTALRLKLHELQMVTDELRKLSSKSAREEFKDSLINVIRDKYDDAQWTALITEARARQKGPQHG